MKWKKIFWPDVPRFDLTLRPLTLPPSTTMEATTTSPTGTTSTYSTEENPGYQTTDSTTSILSNTTAPALDPTKTYELSPAQFKRLWSAANMEGMAFLVPSPKFDDNPALARDLQHLSQQFDELVVLGLVVDVSDHYADNVAEAWNEQGRHVRFMCLSELGQLMFVEGEKKGLVN